MKQVETIRVGKRFITFSYGAGWKRYKFWLISEFNEGVKSILSNKLLKRHYNSKGYLRVKVDNKFWLEHRLVMFVYEGPSDLEVDHGDGVRDNNAWSNLQYVTGAENAKRARARKWPVTTGAPF